MGYLATKLQILRVLEENLHTVHPQVVETRSIAERLGMARPELHRAIQIMNKSGEVESDQDCERLVITREGLRSLGLS